VAATAAWPIPTVADYISSSIEASNGGLLVTVYFQVSLGGATAPIAVAS
jgi:hypothetical protein